MVLKADVCCQQRLVLKAKPASLCVLFGALHIHYSQLWPDRTGDKNWQPAMDSSTTSTPHKYAGKEAFISGHDRTTPLVIFLLMTYS